MKNINIRIILPVFLLIVLVLFTYSNSFDNDFVDWDDYTYVVENDLVRNTQATSLKDVFSELVSLNYHPLTILSLRLNNNECAECREGISPAPFIMWNVILHIINTILVFGLIYKLSDKKILVAFLVAAIFGVHPMHVESVAWISERKDLLYTLFFLSGLLSYLKYDSYSEEKKIRYLWLAATFLLFVLSCLSKAMAVVFPLVLMLIKFWQHKQAKDKMPIESLKEIFRFRNLIFLLPFFLFSLFWGLMAIKINNLNTFSIWHHIQFASYGSLMYIVKFFVPVNLSAIYPYPTLEEYTSGTVGIFLRISPFIFLLAAGSVLYSLKKTKLFVFGIGFFFVSIMMVSQFISVGVAIMADRYTYVAYIGLAFLTVMLLLEYSKKLRYLFVLLTVAFIIMLALLSHKQIEIWSNSETLWTNVIELYPKLESPRSIRGLYFRKKAELAEDEKQKVLYEEKAFDDFKFAIKAGTKKADVYEETGCIYGKYGDLNNALTFLNKAIELNPKKGSAYYNRGLIYGMLERNEEAIMDYNIAILYQPEKSFEIINNRSNLLMITGKFKEAILDYNYLLSEGGNNFDYFYNRGLAKQATKDVFGAETDYLKALRLNPDDELCKDQLKLLFPEKY